MVGVINPNETQTLHEQVLAAARADFQLAPGDPVPNEASSTVASPTAASSAGDLASADRSPPALSTAAIVGITIGAILFLALCAGLLFFLLHKTRPVRQTIATEASQTPHNEYYRDPMVSPTFSGRLNDPEKKEYRSLNKFPVEMNACP
ncbi:hypothetical protein IG631_22620 [Alternaria alternata]|nr:hypothetical protein IG631_22620 [Alternaria alternata]